MEPGVWNIPCVSRDLNPDGSVERRVCIYFTTISDLDVNQMWHRTGVTTALDSISQWQAGHQAGPRRCEDTDGCLAAASHHSSVNGSSFYEFRNTFWLFHRSRSHLQAKQSFLKNRQWCSYSRISQHFMEPEGSLQCSQEPSTGPYPERDRSSPYHPVISLSDPF
jgi:hypothetical protein